MRLVPVRQDEGVVEAGGPESGSWAGPLSRLYMLVAPSSIDPAVETPPQVVPLDSLAWENFIASLTSAQLAGAVSDFLAGRWAPASRVFAFATSLPAVRSELADKIRTRAERLAGQGIEFEVWDGGVMSLWRKHRLSLVYDFFGRARAERFCGPEAVARLAARQVGALRDRLGRFMASRMAASGPAAPVSGGVRRRQPTPQWT